MESEIIFHDKITELMTDYFSVLPKELRDLLKFFVNYIHWKLFNDILGLCKFDIVSRNKAYIFEEYKQYRADYEPIFSQNDIEYVNMGDQYRIPVGQIVPKHVVLDFLKQCEKYHKYSPIRYKINKLLQEAKYINLQNEVSFYHYHVR